MSIPTHYLHVYQRPKQGSAFIKSHPLVNYQHSINIQGWFDTASCDLNIRALVDGEDILNNYLGCFVQIFVDNPLVPIWEGLINRITLNYGLLSQTVSLDDMANRVTTVYTGAANVAAQDTAVDNLISQSVYGIKQDQIEFGVDPSVATQRTTLINTIIAQRSYPQSSSTRLQGQSGIVHLELVGVFHTLEWTKLFTVTTTATVNVSTSIINTLAADANVGTFFAGTNTTQIGTNPMTVPQQTRGQSLWERIQRGAEAGDTNTYWMAGVLPTNPNSKLRLFYYRQSSAVVRYLARQADGLRIRSPFGQLIPPWLVVPDQAIRIPDAIIGTSGSLPQGDPSVMYIQSIQYDANSQIVQWMGADDTTLRASFKLKRAFKTLSSPFGAPNRIIVT